MQIKSTMFHVTEDKWDKTIKMFNRTKETLNEDIEIIIEWLKIQPHLPEIMEDAKIRNFLFLNKCSVEKTKEKIDMYYTIRSLIPDFYEKSNPKLSNMQKMMELAYCFVHPYLIEDMYRAFFLKVKQPNVLLPAEMVMQCTNIAEIRLKEDCIVRDIFILDMKEFSLNDLTKITPTVVAKTFAILERVYSLRIKGIYFINSKPYVAKLVTLIKPLVKAKIFQRIHALEDEDVLKQFFPNDILPRDYGGNGPSLHELNEMMKLKLIEYQERFDQLDKLRVDESKRPEKFDNDELLGFYGHFKKLDVD